MLKLKLNLDEDDIPIAHIINKKGKIINNICYSTEINDDDNESNESDEEYEDNVCEYCKKSFFRPNEKRRHYKCCKKKMLEDYHNMYYGKNDNHFKITKNKFELVGDEYVLSHHCNPNKRENLLIMGPSGSGKSMYSSQYAKSYHTLFPENNIYLFSKIDGDAAFNKSKYILKIKLDDIENEQIDVKNEMGKSLVLFDDIEDSTNKGLTNFLSGINNEILVQGRDQSGKGNDIYCVTTIHISDYKNTRKLINEATSITLFNPLNFQAQNMLVKYCGLTKNQVNKLKNLNSRWLTVFMHHPQILLTQNNVFLLSSL